MAKLSKQLRTRISNLMRRDFKKTKMANDARNRAFKGKTVYHCALCDSYYYTGQSDKNFDKEKEKYPNLKKCKESEFHLDHVIPVVPVDKTLYEMTLDEIALRVYCKTENISYICENCHKKKTAGEKTQRAEKARLVKK